MTLVIAYDCKRFHVRNRFIVKEDDPQKAMDIVGEYCRKQCIGIAGLYAEPVEFVDDIIVAI